MLSLFTFASIPGTVVRDPISTFCQTAAALVFDGVLTRDEASAMSDYVSNELTGFYVFDRKDSKPASQIEKFLDQTLSNLGDQSRWIEYWVGREWSSHPMHRDVDERMCFDQAINRFPRYGHVLYLSTDENVTGGQTVVLSEGGEEVPVEDGIVLDGYKRRSLFIVPPHPGRILRFQGSLLHAVPRPALEYFLSELNPEEVLQLPVCVPLSSFPSVKELHDVALTNGDEEWLSEDYQRQHPHRRVNLLFNSWPDAPPQVTVAENKTPMAPSDVVFPVSVQPRPVLFCPLQANDDEEEDDGNSFLTMRIKLPQDRRRRDTYESCMTLRTTRSAPEAFVRRISGTSDSYCHPRVIPVWSKEDEE